MWLGFGIGLTLALLVVCQCECEPLRQVAVAYIIHTQDLGLYKILFSCEAVVHESIIRSCPPAHLHCPPWCNASARSLGSARLLRTLVCMLCIIQYWQYQYRVKAKQEHVRIDSRVPRQSTTCMRLRLLCGLLVHPWR